MFFVAGQPGNNGFPGQPGSTGATGFPGNPGPIGATGGSGSPGFFGSTGATGSTGPFGQPGQIGATGEQIFSQCFYTKSFNSCNMNNSRLVLCWLMKFKISGVQQNDDRDKYEGEMR